MSGRTITRPRATVAPPAAPLQGSFDHAQPDGTLEGWCWSPAEPLRHRTVAVSMDGREIVRVRCDGERADLRHAKIGSGDHAFVVCLDAADMVPGATVSLALRDVETGQPIGNAQQVTWPLDAPVAPPPATRAPLQGTLDRVTRDGWVSGWTWDPTTPDDRIELEILVDDEVVGETVAAGFRADLQAAGIGDGAHGFFVRPPI